MPPAGLRICARVDPDQIVGHRIDDALAEQGSKTMSLESTIILAAIALAFAIFAAALAWGDLQTRDLGKSEAADCAILAGAPVIPGRAAAGLPPRASSWTCRSRPCGRGHGASVGPISSPSPGSNGASVQSLRRIPQRLPVRHVIRRHGGCRPRQVAQDFREQRIVQCMRIDLRVSASPGRSRVSEIPV